MDTATLAALTGLSPADCRFWIDRLPEAIQRSPTALIDRLRQIAALGGGPGENSYQASSRRHKERTGGRADGPASVARPLGGAAVESGRDAVPDCRGRELPPLLRVAAAEVAAPRKRPPAPVLSPTLTLDTRKGKLSWPMPTHTLIGSPVYVRVLVADTTVRVLPATAWDAGGIAVEREKGRRYVYCDALIAEEGDGGTLTVRAARRGMALCAARR